MRGGKRPNAGRKSSADQRKLKESRERTNQNLIPFKPGQSGNPGGRPPNIGRSLEEKMNDLGDDPAMTVEKLRALARNPKTHPVTAAAAKQVLQMAMHATLADFESLQDGKTLRDLEAEGVPVELLRKRKKTERSLTSANGVTDTTVSYELEMHPIEVAGLAFDRVADRTEGKPTQRVEVKDDSGTLRTPADGAALLVAVCTGLAKRLGVPDPAGG